jgi:hypothetical protein
MPPEYSFSPVVQRKTNPRQNLQDEYLVNGMHIWIDVLKQSSILSDLSDSKNGQHPKPNKHHWCKEFQLALSRIVEWWTTKITNRYCVNFRIIVFDSLYSGRYRN